MKMDFLDKILLLVWLLAVSMICAGVSLLVQLPSNKNRRKQELSGVFLVCTSAACFIVVIFIYLGKQARQRQQKQDRSTDQGPDSVSQHTSLPNAEVSGSGHSGRGSSMGTSAQNLLGRYSWYSSPSDHYPCSCMNQENYVACSTHGTPSHRPQQSQPQPYEPIWRTQQQLEREGMYGEPLQENTPPPPQQQHYGNLIREIPRPHVHLGNGLSVGDSQVQEPDQDNPQHAPYDCIQPRERRPSHDQSRNGASHGAAEQLPLPRHSWYSNPYETEFYHPSSSYGNSNIQDHPGHCTGGASQGESPRTARQHSYESSPAEPRRRRHLPHKWMKHRLSLPISLSSSSRRQGSSRESSQLPLPRHSWYSTPYETEYFLPPAPNQSRFDSLPNPHRNYPDLVPTTDNQWPRPQQSYHRYEVEAERVQQRQHPWKWLTQRIGSSHSLPHQSSRQGSMEEQAHNSLPRFSWYSTPYERELSPGSSPEYPYGLGRTQSQCSSHSHSEDAAMARRPESYDRARVEAWRRTQTQQPQNCHQDNLYRPGWQSGYAGSAVDMRGPQHYAACDNPEGAWRTQRQEPYGAHHMEYRPQVSHQQEPYEWTAYPAAMDQADMLNDDSLYDFPPPYSSLSPSPSSCQGYNGWNRCSYESLTPSNQRSPDEALQERGMYVERVPLYGAAGVYYKPDYNGYMDPPPPYESVVSEDSEEDLLHIAALGGLTHPGIYFSH